MRIASLPIAVIMQRRVLKNRWASEQWAAVAVVPDPSGEPSLRQLTANDAGESYLATGLHLDLHPDENEGYFENCMAPEAKVFIMWRMQGDKAVPVQASVSYAEGTRMFDSGESADGVAMPAEIHAWLWDYLCEHYTPPVKRGKGHRHA
jgi:hypothetical protein